jgi:uncharacterized protein YhaN
MPNILGQITVGGKTINVSDANRSSEELLQKLSAAGYQTTPEELASELTKSNITFNSNSQAVNPSIEMLKQQLKEIDEQLQYPKVGSIDYGRLLEQRNKVETSLKNLKPKHEETQRVATGELQDLIEKINQKKRLEELVKFKSEGFEGEGIDTGPVVGAEIPWFGENPKLYPAWLSEEINKRKGIGMASGDRGVFRQKILSVLNPVKKDISGTAVSDKEFARTLRPSVPSETDQDITFYRKGFDKIKSLQDEINELVKSYESGGRQMEKFKGEVEDPQKAVDDLIDYLSTTKGEYKKTYTPKTKVKSDVIDLNDPKYK